MIHVYDADVQYNGQNDKIALYILRCKSHVSEEESSTSKASIIPGPSQVEFVEKVSHESIAKNCNGLAMYYTHHQKLSQSFYHRRQERYSMT